MPTSHGERYDFFLSRRGSVAAIAREVADVLTEKGYKVFVQDYDIPLGDSFIEAIHEGVKNSRDLVILFTRDYEQSPYTRKEFTSFEAERAQSAEQRHIVVLRCEDVPLRGLLADNVYQDLVAVEDPEERRRRIIAAVEHQSQAAAPPPRPFIGVPPRIASFTGRTEALDRLDAILMHDKPAAVTQAVGRAAVQGMGGVGKTSLAIEYAHRFRGLYAGVCWCPAETRNGHLSTLAALAVTLGAAAADEADVEKAAKAALRRLAEQRATWLLIYDNVTSPDEVADLLPSAGSRVLITSRFSDWGELAHEVALDVLPLAQAVALLESRTVRDDAEGARMLAAALGQLPLALDHAAAYCRRTQMSFADYARKASTLIANAPRGGRYPRSVAATFDLAIAAAVAECSSAETLIAIFAICAAERIPMTLVQGVVEEDEKRLEALASLSEVSLIKNDPFEDGTPAVTVHRLVQSVALERSEARGIGQQYVKGLIARLRAIYPEDGYSNPEAWPLCARITPHMLSVSAKDHTAQTENAFDRIALLTRAGNYFHGRALFSHAASLFRDVLAIRERLFGPESLDIAQSLNDLSLVLFDEGDFVGARSLSERVLAIREKSLGPDHPDTAGALNELARVLHHQGDLAAAQPIYERALAIKEKSVGPDHPSTALSLNNLARLLHDRENRAGARQLLERALAIQEKVYGYDHLETALMLHNLAGVLEDQEEARSLYQRALVIREKSLGPEHPDTANSLNNLANLFGDSGDYAAARPLMERSLAICDKIFGSGHPNTNLVRTNLARLLLATRQNTDSALALSEVALAFQDEALGRDHPWTKRSVGIAAAALDALGRTDEAKVLRERYGLTGIEESKAP